MSRYEPDREAWPGAPIRVAASILAHVLLLAALLVPPPVRVAAVHLPGTARGTQLALAYLPAGALSAPAATARAKPRRVVATLSRQALAAPGEPRPAQVPQHPAGGGVDALGDGDISIALMQFFPDPRPDLSRLPRGSRGDVVLEAIIDASGRIVQLTVKQGLGYGVDESVIATVEQWTFHPAMRDGKPVASQQEFHFHYERG
jgi:protein TonB